MQISILPLPKAVTNKLRKGLSQSTVASSNRMRNSNRAAGVMAKIRGVLEEKRASMDSNPDLAAAPSHSSTVTARGELDRDRGGLSSPPMSPVNKAMGGLSMTTSPVTPASRKHYAAMPSGHTSRSSSFLVPTTTSTGIITQSFDSLTSKYISLTYHLKTNAT